MGMLAGIGSLVGSGIGLAGNMGLFGSGGGVPNAPSMPNINPQTINLGGITPNISSGIGGLEGYNLGGQNLGQYQNILQNNVNNPFFGNSTQTALQYAPYAQGAANTGIQNATTLGGQVPTLSNAASGIINTAFDPQQALYNRTAQQVGDQQLVGLENSGLAQTPWGQGVYGNTMSNFNIDWQNAQLGRQLQGIQGADSALGAAGNLASGAFGLGSQAAGAGAQTGFMPYNAYNTVTGNQLNTLTGGSQYGQSASNIPQTGIGDWLQYLSGANQANQVGLQTAKLPLDYYNAQLAGNQQGFQQNQAFGQGIGSGLQALSGFAPFGGMGGGTPNYGQSSNVNIGGYSMPSFGWG